MKWHPGSILILVLLILASNRSLGNQQSPPSDAEEWTGSDQQKLYGLMTIWAEAKYGFPSFASLPDLDWDRSLQEFIPRVMEADGVEPYYWVLMEFAGLLSDGHTSVLPPWGYLKPDYDNPPLEVQILEDEFVVARVGESQELRDQGVLPGLEILEIDDVPIGSFFEESVNRYYPRGSKHANEALNIVYLLRGPKDSVLRLTVRDETGDLRDVTLTRNSTQTDGSPFFPRALLWMMAESPLESRWLPDGVRYVRLSHFEDPKLAEEFLGLIDEMESDGTKGLVIDLRFCLGGRGDIAESMIGAMIDKPVSSPLWKYPHHVAAHKSWGREPEWSTANHTIQPREGARYAGPIVILTAGTASSTAEDFAISLRHAGRAVLVGERTAGSAGNPLDVLLPGGGQFRMATFRAYLPNGEEYVGIGVKPDVEVRPTKSSIGEGSDPVLEKGLELWESWDEP